MCNEVLFSNRDIGDKCLRVLKDPQYAPLTGGGGRGRGSTWPEV